ncbi:MAG: cohesin domain-containing protein, partial [bacterium]
SNDFIHLEVNPGPNEAGRFSIETVRGDPTVDTDDKKILIYGRPRPWTSFTTVRIDDKNHVFGGPTRRRAGRDGEYGEVVAPPKVDEDNAIVMKCRIAGLDVTQRLEIAGGPVSGMLDSIRISYIVSNPTDEAHKVSLRVLLDTLLGSNDGAPFRVGERDVTSEARMTGGEVVDSWVAFDSLENPGVVARGTLRGEGLTVPDEVVFANWGKLADKAFEIPFEEGRSFQREGEEEMDSATALYWRGREVLPGGELRFVTVYGIDYLHVVGDILSIGSVPFLGRWQTGRNQIRPHSLYVYVGNLAEFDLTNVAVSVDLPDGVLLSEGDTKGRGFELLKPGEERAVGWRLEPKPFSDGERQITIRAKSAEVEGVEMKTSVTLLSPPGVDGSVIAPEALTLIDGKRYGPANPFQIQLVCRNKGESPIDNLEVRLDLPEGLVFPAIIVPAQTFSRLDGKETIVFTWKVIATGAESGEMPYRISVTSDSTEPKLVEGVIQVPPMPTKVEWAGVPATAGPKVIFPAEVFINSARHLKKAEFSVEFNPEVLMVIRVSQGTAFVEEGKATPWREPKIDNRRGVVSGIVGDRGVKAFSGNGSLAVIHFVTKGQGGSAIKVTGLRLMSPSEKIQAVVEDASIEVK